jgi:hypothetical protein
MLLKGSDQREVKGVGKCISDEKFMPWTVVFDVFFKVD